MQASSAMAAESHSMSGKIGANEYHHLKRSGWRSWKTYLLLLPVTIVIAIGIIGGKSLMPIPGAVPFPDFNFWVMLLCSHFFFVYVMVRTSSIAAHVINREITSGTWETLIMSGIPASEIIRGKFWAVLRYVWFDHVMAALPRVVLLYIVMAQYISAFDIDGPLCHSLNGAFTPYCFRAFMFIGYDTGLLSILAAVVMLVLFSLVGAAVVIIVSMWAALRQPRVPYALPIVWGSWFFASVLIVMLLVAIASLKLPVYGFNIIPDWAAYCDRGERFDYYDCGEVLRLRDTLRVIETGQVAMGSLVDNGLSAGFNMLLPGIGLTALVRNVFSGMLALGVYGLVIILFLRWAVRRAQKIGAI